MGAIHYHSSLMKKISKAELLKLNEACQTSHKAIIELRQMLVERDVHHVWSGLEALDRLCEAENVLNKYIKK